MEAGKEEEQIEKEVEKEKEWVRTRQNAYVDRDATVEEEIIALEEFYGPSYCLRTDSGFKVCFESPNVFCVIYVDVPVVDYLNEAPFIEVECQELNEREVKELKSVLDENAEEYVAVGDPFLYQLMDDARSWLYWNTGEPEFANQWEAADEEHRQLAAEKAKKEKEELAAKRAAIKPAPKPRKPKATPTPKPKPQPQPSYNYTSYSYYSYTPYDPVKAAERKKARLAEKERERKEKEAQAARDKHYMTVVVGSRYEDLYGIPLPPALELEYGIYRNPSRRVTNPVLTERPDFAGIGEEVVVALEEAFVHEYTRLNLTRKNIQDFPLPLLGCLTNLTEINFSFNNIADIPVVLAQLTNLQKLILSNNQITQLYPELCESLTQLRVLDLTCNKLLTLPAQIENLTNLQLLELGKNALRLLPQQLGELVKLEKLIVEHNKLTAIPPEIGFLTKMTAIKLNNNPIKSLPPDIYHQGTQKVLEYLRQAVPELETGSNLKRFAFSSDFSDVHIYLNKGTPLKCHKVVLVARSPKFAEILSELPEEEEPDKPTELRVNWDNPGSFKNLIRYLYNDAVDTKALQKHYKELESLALFYRVPRLHQICEKIEKQYIVLSESTFAKDFAMLLEEPVRYSDVSFLVEEDEIKAHKVFLAASSEYFKGMFQSGLKEAQERVVPLPLMKRDVFLGIREYCYTGDIAEITGEIAIDLLSAANEYTLPRLKSIVESLLGYSIDGENAPCLYEVAVLYNTPVLERACLFFILQNMKKVELTDAWKDLSVERKKEIRAKAAKWGFNAK